MKACGLSRLPLPSRRTFDRRPKTVSIDIKERITTMGCLFVTEGIVKPYIMAIDSTLIQTRGKLWHKSSMDKGIIPHSGIDTAARWGYSHTKGWIFGYKLHLISSTWFFYRCTSISVVMLQQPMYMTIKFIKD